MKIAMIGCGAAGSCFAGYLRKGGADITLVDRYQAHMDKVAKDGLEFIVYPDTHYHLDGFKTAYTADDIGIMDIVIFVTKATQLESAVQSAMPCIGPDTVLCSLINGLGNDDILLKHFPANRILCGSGALGTQLREPGCCVSTEVQGTLVHFGALENGPVTDKAGKHLAEVFTKGGCRAEFNEDDRPNIWKKVIINCTVNTVCALLRLKIYEVAEDPYGMELFRGVVREACDVDDVLHVPRPADIQVGQVIAGVVGQRQCADLGIGHAVAQLQILQQLSFQLRPVVGVQIAVFFPGAAAAAEQADHSKQQGGQASSHIASPPSSR